MSQEEAEMKATSFVRENVKFYSKNGSDIDMIPSLNIVILESFKEGDYWNVIVDASSQVGNDTKDAQLKVVLNSKTGEIIRFLQVKST